LKYVSRSKRLIYWPPQRWRDLTSKCWVDVKPTARFLFA
jgi:hypothetical protein